MLSATGLRNSALPLNRRDSVLFKGHRNRVVGNKRQAKSSLCLAGGVLPAAYFPLRGFFKELSPD